MVRIPDDELAAIDRWIEEDSVLVEGRRLSRPEALRRLAVEALEKLGLYGSKTGEQA